MTALLFFKRKDERYSDDQRITRKHEPCVRPALHDGGRLSMMSLWIVNKRVKYRLSTECADSGTNAVGHQHKQPLCR